MIIDKLCESESFPLLQWNQQRVEIANKVTWYGEYVHYLITRLAKEAVNRWMSPIVLPTTEFVVVDSIEPWVENMTRSGDVEINSEYIDGQNGILGYVPLPTEGDEVSACNRCGSVWMDQWELWTTRFWFGVFLHEFGHVLGIEHSDDPNSVMYPRYRGQLDLGTWDVARVVERYEATATT